jgi:hypothetical protein
MTGVINDIFPCLCNEVCGISGMFYVIARVYGTIKQITADISQTSLHKHGTIT